MLKFKSNKAGANPSRFKAACLFSLTLVLAVLIFPGTSGAYTEIDEPRVDTSFLFHEAKLTFSGRVDDGCEVIVKVVGSGKKVILGHNGLTASNYVVVDNLPGQYRVLGSGSLSGLSPEVTGEYNSLKDRAVAYSWSDEKKVFLTGPEGEKQIQKAISLNEQNGRYRFMDNAISIQNGKFSGSLYIGRPEFTSQVQVDIMALRDNAVVARKTRTVDIQGSLFNGPLDIEKEPLLFTGMFFCLTVITVIGAEEMLSRRRKTAYR